jgi:hypothetical protein
MIGLLACFSSQTRQINITRTYTKLDLQENTNLFIPIGSGKRAFIFGTNRFYEDTRALVSDGDFSSDINITEISTVRGLAVTGEEVELSFTSVSRSTVEIWIIDDGICGDYAVAIDSRSPFEFTFNPGEDFKSLCVFPINTAVQTVTFGFGNRAGDASLLIDNDRFSCMNDVCTRNVHAPFYVSFSKGSGEIRLTGRGGDGVKDTCQSGYISYVNVNTSDDRRFQQATGTLWCSSSNSDQKEASDVGRQSFDWHRGPGPHHIREHGHGRRGRGQVRVGFGADGGRGVRIPVGQGRAPRRSRDGRREGARVDEETQTDGQGSGAEGAGKRTDAKGQEPVLPLNLMAVVATVVLLLIGVGMWLCFRSPSRRPVTGTDTKRIRETDGKETQTAARTDNEPKPPTIKLRPGI